METGERVGDVVRAPQAGDGSCGSVEYRLEAAVQVAYGVFTRSSKRPAIHVYFEYICWKFAGRLLDRVNTLL